MALYRFADVASLGIIRDQYPHELPDGAWSDGANVRFVDGSAKKIGGYLSNIGTTTVAPYGIAYAESVTAKFWAYFGLTKAYSYDGTTHRNITRQTTGADVNYTGTASDKWAWCNLSGILCAVNGIDNVQSWAPGTGTICDDLANWTGGHTCKAIRSFKQHLIALNVKKSAAPYPYLVKWSHPAEPGAEPVSWDHTDTTKDAGEQDLGDAYGPILDGAAHGDIFYVWKSNATWGMTYAGPPQIFNFTKITEQSGILATNCWCETPLGIFVVSSNDVMLQNGLEAPRSVIDGRNRKWLFANINVTYAARSFVVHNVKQSEAMICFPSLTSAGWCDTALIWNYASDTWGVRGLPLVSNGAAGHWEDGTFANVVPGVLMVAPGASEGYAFDTTEGDGASAQTSRLERTGITFGTPDKVKLVRAVRPRIDGTTGRTVSVYVSGTMDFDAAASWNGPYTFTIGTSLKVDCLVSGRYFGFKFEASSSGATPAAWRMRSFDVDVVDASNY